MMNIHRLAHTGLLCALLALNPVLADPPPSKGNPNKSSQGNSGNNGNSGNQGNQGNSGNKGNNGNDNNAQSQGNPQSGSDLALNLVAAGITAIAAQNLALNYGVVGYQPLPPGIAKNLARGKPLPPGIAKKYPPGPMLNQLPVHPGYEWRMAGSDLILVAVGTAIVADVLRNVFR